VLCPLTDMSTRCRRSALPTEQAARTGNPRPSEGIWCGAGRLELPPPARSTACDPTQSAMPVSAGARGRWPRALGALQTCPHFQTI